MEIVIGTRGRDIRIATIEDSKALKARVETAFKDGDSHLWLTDSDGTEYCVPTSSITFVQFDSEAAGRRVGFGPQSTSAPSPAAKSSGNSKASK